MIPKYIVEFSVAFTGHAQTGHYQGDDPVACEQFVLELLERGYRITAIKHEGVPMSGPDIDRILKTAAGMLASKHVCRSLGIDSVEAHRRFGFPA